MKHSNEKIFKIMGIFLTIICSMQIGKVEASLSSSDNCQIVSEGYSYKEWYDYYDNLREPEATISVKCNGKSLDQNSVAKLKPGEKLIISAKIDNQYSKVSRLYCKLNGDLIIDRGDSEVVYEIPQSIKTGEKLEFIVAVNYINTYEASYELVNGACSLNPITYPTGVLLYPGYADTIIETYYFEVEGNAEDEEVIKNVENKNIKVKINGTEIKEGKQVEVQAGDKIEISATPSSEVEKLIYELDGVFSSDTDSSTYTFVIPETLPEREYKLIVNAKFSDGLYIDNSENDGNGKEFLFELVVDEIEVEVEADVKVDVNGNKIEKNSTTKVKVGDIITVQGNVSTLSTSFNNEITYQESAAHGSALKNTIKITSSLKVGTEYLLTVTYPSAEDKYYFIVEEDDVEVNIVENKDIKVKINGTEIKEGKQVEVKAGDKIEISATPSESVEKIIYELDNLAKGEKDDSKYTITIPEGVSEGEYELIVNALFEDGLYVDGKKDNSNGETYEIKIIKDENNNDLDDDNKDDDNQNDDTNQEQIPEEDIPDEVENDLLNESWMKENDEIEKLSISLRNDSEEEDKANRNIYELNETVTYYIDYKNGGKDITDKVSIVLELPLDYTKVDLGNGNINSYDEIEWVFEDGLEKNEAGTIVVSVKYTSLQKSRDTMNTIYPTVSINENNKIRDISTVINTIITSYDEDLDVEHYPYMFGDAGTYTFRPDYSITRAEGALVLVRIFGVDYRNITEITTRYTDINETYYEAQQAITAATNLALVNGYLEENETYTFRPNEKITKAEFMKILASMVQVMAEQQEIEGLEVKLADNLVKVYGDTYNKNGTFHWAAGEITLLARLNMLPLGGEYPKFDIEDTITRAEVTQLINFYLLRAPANVTSKTNILFTDLSKNHKLIENIVEATRETHTVSITNDVEEE